MTLVDLLASAFTRHADQVAVRWKEGETWNELSYVDLASDVEAVAKGLIARGVGPGDPVCILSGSRPEWVVADLAILWIGAVTVPIYSNSSLTTARFIFRHCEAKMILVSERYLPLAREAKLPSQILVRADKGDLRHDQLRRDGERISTEKLELRRRKIQPEDVATLIYTSGTTGDPKGVMLTHANLVSNIEAMTAVVEIGPGDRTLSFLPLSHALEHTAGILTMLSKGVTISFAQEMTTIAQDFLDVRPTIVIAVPRMLEKYHARVREVAATRSKFLRILFERALRSGRWNPLFPLYELLIYRKARGGFGGSTRIVVSGGAPLLTEVARFFDTIGQPILEGYGLTETSPLVTVNRPGQNRIGTVGPPIPGVEVKIASDGEIWVRGPNVMKGYYKDPQGTAEVIDPDGWFRTGDIGETDRDGHLRITDRKKDLIITSGGKKVAPQPIENEITTDPLIDQVCLVGDGKNYIVALVVPHFATLESRAREHGLRFSSSRELVEREEVRAWFEVIFSRVNATRTSYETVKRFRLLSSPWTIDEGELTPTLKVRRREIARRYHREVEELYKGSVC
ncbi:MAG: long-chain fatty acid--CoA ligase [Pseudomonadota bacterium]